MHFFKNLPIKIYIALMKRTACLIGNSSSGIREGSFIGTPVVNIGSRQAMRQRGGNVIDSLNEKGVILSAIEKQLAHGHYKPEYIYGDGCSGKRIAEILATLKTVEIQKRITY
jgi:UDP-N-acetylglucosamine 2-epimerase